MFCAIFAQLNFSAVPNSINKATEVAAAFRGSSASDPAVRMALAQKKGGRYLASDKLSISN